MVKNLPALRETHVQSLSWKDALEKVGQPTPVFLPGESHGQGEPSGLQSMESQRVRHNWVTNTQTHTYEIYWLYKLFSNQVILEQKQVLMCAQLLSHVWTFVTPWTAAHQAPLSMGFLRQEYWSGLPFSTLGIFPTQVLNPCHLLGRQILYHLRSPGMILVKTYLLSKLLCMYFSLVFHSDKTRITILKTLLRAS